MGSGWAVAMALALVASCADRHEEPPTPPSAIWSAGFVQDRPDQDSPNAHVVVRNESPDRHTLVGYRLRWSGYELGQWQLTDPRLFHPGYSFRFDVRLVRPSCSVPTQDMPAVQLELADGSTATAPMDPAGLEALRRVWQRQCAEQRLLRAVDVQLGDSWRPVRRPDGPALLGHLVARRGTTDTEVRLVETLGSVLLTLEPMGPDRILLDSAQDHGRLPLLVSASRCDAHALSGSTQTFTLRVWLSLGGGPAQSLVVRPDDAARRQLEALIRNACRLE